MEKLYFVYKVWSYLFSLLKSCQFLFTFCHTSSNWCVIIIVFSSDRIILCYRIFIANSVSMKNSIFNVKWKYTRDYFFQQISVSSRPFSKFSSLAPMIYMINHIWSIKLFCWFQRVTQGNLYSMETHWF